MSREWIQDDCTSNLHVSLDPVNQTAVHETLNAYLFDINFSTGSHSGAVSFRAIKNNYGHHDAFSFSMLYLGRDEADAVVVKETANDEM